MKRMDKRCTKNIEQNFKEKKKLIKNEFISRIFKEVWFAHILKELNYLLQYRSINVYSKKIMIKFKDV